MKKADVENCRIVLFYIGKTVATLSFQCNRHSENKLVQEGKKWSENKLIVVGGVNEPEGNVWKLVLCLVTK